MAQFHTPLAALLAGAGVLHLVPATARYFDTLIPDELPGTARTWTVGSGIAELATAGLLSRRRTRRLGGTVAAALFVAVFPGNLKMAYDWRHSAAWMQLIAYGRLPLQLPLVWAGWQVRQQNAA
jgi:uncharacterized membrane protein